MSIFKRQTSPCPPSYRRSLSEPAYTHSEIGTSLKSYPWRGPVKSKRKKNEQAVSSLGKPLGAYRWQTHHSLRLKGDKKEQLENNKGDLDEPPQQAVLPKMVWGVPRKDLEPLILLLKSLHIPQETALQEICPFLGQQQLGLMLGL